MGAGTRSRTTSTNKDRMRYVAIREAGLGNVIPFTSRASPQFEGTVCRRQRLGGVLNFYERKAA
jgi:hypothetical protein